MTDQNRPGPVEIEIDTLPDLPDPGADGTFDAPDAVAAPARGRLALLTAGPRSALARWLLRGAGAFVTFALGIWAWDFVTGLLARSPVLGGIAATLAGVVLALLALISLRELAALSRIRRIDRLREAAGAARSGASLEGARDVSGRITDLYRGRAEAAWGLARLAELAPDAADARTLLDMTEREVLAPLDARALAEVEAAAARVATITALVPLALADVAAVLLSSLMMIRRITEVYGGRSGTIGAWRLARAVVGHLAATGLVAAGDDLIGSALGGGVLSKLSRRFGEGLINGALTARVGIAAMELARPLPYIATPRPSVTGTVRRALAGLFTR